MGIDALMFVRIKGRDNWLTETETIALSHKAGQCFGADNFFILHQEEKWSGARHAIEIVKPWKSEDECGEYRELDGLVAHQQDGDPVVADEDEQFLNVGLRTRYYGVGYERGDFPFLFLLSEWLEVQIPGGEVWYGGDSSGVLAEHFDATGRRVLLAYFFRVGHAPYEGGFGMGGEKVPCGFCDGAPMNDNGGGRGHGFHSCGGCGYQVISDRKTGAVLRALGPGEDFFAGAAVLAAERGAEAAP